MRFRCVIIAVCVMSLPATGSAGAQEIAVRAAISEMLAALNGDDPATFSNFLHDDARGFFVDGSTMIEGVSVMALRAAYFTGLDTNLAMSDLNVMVYRDAAVAGALFQGSVTMPGGATISGTWRYSETRVLDDGTWKVVQYHVSQLGQAVAR